MFKYFRERRKLKKWKSDIKRYLMFELLFKAVESMFLVTDVVIKDFDYYKVDLKIKKDGLGYSHYTVKLDKLSKQNQNEIRKYFRYKKLKKLV